MQRQSRPAYLMLMRRPTFLMAEPEPLEGLSTRKLVLETAKFNVITAHSNRETLELLKEFPNVEAIVLHGSLEGLDCTQVVAAAKANPQPTPIIFLTPSDSRQCPGSDHRVDSHEPDELLQLLRSLFGDPRKLDQDHR